MTLSRKLVGIIRSKPITDEDLRAAAGFVLDTFACAVGALECEPARILRQVAPPWNSDIARRAFHIGGLAHILELDDLHRNSITHPGCVVIPAAWAIAEAYDLGGRDFLAAVLAGYEACARVGMAVGKAHYRVWHNTGTCGPFGSAMAAAELLRLSDDQAMWALGNAGTQSAGLWEFLAAGAMSKHLHTARAAEAGVMSALLAREGFTGPDTILEGEKGFFKALCPDPEPDAVIASPDAPWELTRSSIKPWACCRHTHPAIDAAIALHRQIGGREIAHVEVATYRAALDVCDKPNPNSLYSAKFSLQHCVGTALLQGGIEQDSFSATGQGETAEIRSRISLHVSQQIDSAYPGAWGAEVKVVTKDQRTFSALRPVCKGDPEHPLTEPEMSGKAISLFLSGGMDATAADNLAKAIGGLADDLPVRALSLLDYICPDPRRHRTQMRA